MEFPDPQQKRRRALLLFMGYFLFFVVIAMLTVILVYRASGYEVDRKTGTVIQNGFLFIDNKPQSAAITINGMLRGEHTDARIALKSGTYDLKLTRDGYRPWQKQVTIDGGGVEQVRYPRLFPIKLTSAPVETYAAAPVFFSQSIDRHWIAVGKSTAPLVIAVYDSSRDDLAAISLSIDPKVVPDDAALDSFKVVEWAKDNQHFLLSYTRPSGKEFVWIDREKAENAVNINQALGVTPTKAAFNNGDANRLYIFENNNAVVRTADLSARTVSVPITSAALDGFTLKDTLYYVTADPQKSDQAIVRIHEADKDYIMAQISAADVHEPLAVTYNGHTYVLIRASVKGETLVRMYKDPQAALKDSSKTLPDPLRAVTLPDIQTIITSPDYRFVLIGNKDTQVVFDLELSRQYRFSLPDAGADIANLRWIDITHLAYIKAGVMNIVEFDGANQEATVPAAPNTTAYFDRKGEHLLNLAASSDGKISLQNTSVIIK